ncbi:MAG: murein hydrolase activator EnvC family protein [bacterium]
MFSKLLFLFLFVGCFIFTIHTTNGQNKIERHHERLRKIREEIRAVERKIAVSEKKETSVLHFLANLDLEIDLTQSLIQNLKREGKKKANQILKIEKKLKSTQEELQRLKEFFGKRLVYFYKYGRLKDIELLLTAGSVNQGLLWLEYQKRLSQHDYRNYLKIKEKQAKIARDKDLRTIELEEKRKLLDEKLKEEKKLKAKKAERQKFLQSIRRNTDLLRQQLTEKERAADEIRKLILKLEETPSQTPLLRPSIPFSELKNQMIWPTQGNIITRFGKYTHPNLKTVTKNIGIDIQAPAGSPVQVVASGRVTAITWQRGRGNIIIVSHYGGYYTVYTHLEKILVNLLEEVDMRQVIGTVGESGSLRGPLLHFEIWKGTQNLNPELWLVQ